MNRNERLTGSRARLAESVFAASLVFAACSSPATETPKPTSQPTETPTPTLVTPTETPIISPTPTITETPTPTPTPEITPAPTPEATPMLITTITEGKHPKVAVAKVTSDIKTAIDNNPNSVDEYWTKEGILKSWQYCQKGDPTIPGDPYENKELNCQNTIVRFYQTYQGLHDENFYNLAKEVYNYAANTFPTRYINELKKNLEEIF